MLVTLLLTLTCCIWLRPVAPPLRHKTPCGCITWEGPSRVFLEFTINHEIVAAVLVGSFDEEREKTHASGNSASNKTATRSKSLKPEFSYLNQEPRILPISGPHWQHPPHTAVLILEIPDVFGCSARLKLITKLLLDGLHDDRVDVVTSCNEG